MSRGGNPGIPGRRGDEEERGGGGGGWGGHKEYMRDKTSKLDAQYHRTTEVDSVIFAGTVVHVDGETSASKDDLAELIVRNGGQFSQYHSTSTTHIVTSALQTRQPWCDPVSVSLPLTAFPFPGGKQPPARQGQEVV